MTATMTLEVTAYTIDELKAANPDAYQDVLESEAQDVIEDWDYHYHNICEELGTTLEELGFTVGTVQRGVTRAGNPYMESDLGFNTDGYPRYATWGGDADPLAIIPRLYNKADPDDRRICDALIRLIKGSYNQQAVQLRVRRFGHNYNENMEATAEWWYSDSYNDRPALQERFQGYIDDLQERFQAYVERVGRDLLEQADSESEYLQSEEYITERLREEGTLFTLEGSKSVDLP